MNSPCRSIDEADAEEGGASPAVGMRVAASGAPPSDLPTVVKETARTAVHRFFYPHQHKPDYLGTSSGGGGGSARSPRGGGHRRKHARDRRPVPTSDVDGEGVGVGEGSTDDPLQAPAAAVTTNSSSSSAADDGSEIEHTFEDDSTEPEHARNDGDAPPDRNDPDVAFVQNFWTTFDDILILSIFTQLGIVFRLASSSWFTIFDGVFSNDSALFVNLPLNCLSCFIMGVLCSGERLMEIIATRFSPPRSQHDIIRDDTELYDENGDEDGVIRENDGLQRPAAVKSSLFGLRRRRRTRRDKTGKNERKHFVSWQPPVHLNVELRDVQLLALERRIRMSKCLVLFPVRKADVDVMEHYFDQGYKKDEEEDDECEDEDNDNDADEAFGQRRRRQPPMPEQHRGRHRRRRLVEDFENDLALCEESPVSLRAAPAALVENNEGPMNREPPQTMPPRVESNGAMRSDAVSSPARAAPNGAEETSTGTLAQNAVEPSTSSSNGTTQSETGEVSNSGNDNLIGEFNGDYIAEFTSNVQENVQENIERLRRVNLADGWDAGTTPEAMSEDLMLGLRDGFCGALSSFSSWNSAMISLMRGGNFGDALVGYMLGLQMPIIAYRFGQHVAVYIFVWRARQETRRDERRGYGIRVAVDEESERGAPHREWDDDDSDDDEKKAEHELPSIRAVVTAVFIMALVTQCTSISFFTNPNEQQIALSLLFSPLGVLARWRLAKLNQWRPTFPLGTFTCNILACALSGSLGSLLAGNPGPRERIVLVSVVAGFGGTLSSVAAFVVEVLAGVDPILFRFDGMVYAATSIGCAMIVGFIFSASVEWADQTESTSSLIVPEADNIGDGLNQTIAHHNSTSW